MHSTILFNQQQALTNTHNGIPIVLIDNEKSLATLAAQLQTLQEFSIDTEFDSFNKQYGVHLQLIQVFDGHTCYLVDPLMIEDLSALWAVLENRDICKVLYSGANDVDVLKRSGCKPRNLFDVQLGTELCKMPERSLSGILLKEFGVQLDKATQAAGWGNRPLENRQLAYASDDVIFLLRLKALLLPAFESNNVTEILKQQNLQLEAASSKDYVAKLSDKQWKVYSKYSQQKLLSLKLLVDAFAQQLNLPPFKIVRDSLLEEVVKEPATFLRDPFPGKQFHPKVIRINAFTKQFMDIVHSIDPSIPWERPARS